MAKKRGCSVLPVLVQRTDMDLAALPKKLQWLEPIQQTQAGYDDLEHDLSRLCDRLDDLVLPRQKEAS
jgi:hypothetical protein